MRRTFNGQSRFMKKFRLVLLISVVGTLPGLAAATSFASYIRAERRTNPWINLGDGHDVPTVYAAKGGLQIDLEHHLLKPTALASMVRRSLRWSIRTMPRHRRPGAARRPQVESRSYPAQ